jgi:hypothetical protein
MCPSIDDIQIIPGSGKAKNPKYSRKPPYVSDLYLLILDDLKNVIFL